MQHLLMLFVQNNIMLNMKNNSNQVVCSMETIINCVFGIVESCQHIIAFMTDSITTLSRSWNNEVAQHGNNIIQWTMTWVQWQQHNPKIVLLFYTISPNTSKYNLVCPFGTKPLSETKLVIVTWTPGIHFSEIEIKIQENDLEMRSVKWRPFCV